MCGRKSSKYRSGVKPSKRSEQVQKRLGRVAIFVAALALSLATNARAKGIDEFGCLRCYNTANGHQTWWYLGDNDRLGGDDAYHSSAGTGTCDEAGHTKYGPAE